MEKYIIESDKHGFFIILHASPNASPDLWYNLYEEWSFQWFINDDHAYTEVKNEIYESIIISKGEIEAKEWSDKMVVCVCTNKFTKKVINTTPIVLKTSFTKMIEQEVSFNKISRFVETGEIVDI